MVVALGRTSGLLSLLVGLAATRSSPVAVAAAAAARPTGRADVVGREGLARRRHRRRSAPLLPPPTPALSRRGGGDGARRAQEAAASPPRSLPPLLVAASAFGFLGGWSHALCNRRFDVYACLMTGHYLNMSILLAGGEWRKVLWRLSIVGSYASGAASARAMELRHERKGAGTAANPAERPAANGHFRTIAPLACALFVVADHLPEDRTRVAPLAFGYGLIYPSVIAGLGGLNPHMLTGHTNIVARLVGGGRFRDRGMTTSLVVLGSVVSGACFGARVLASLGDAFPHFSVLGVLYACALSLLL